MCGNSFDKKKSNKKQYFDSFLNTFKFPSYFSGLKFDLPNEEIDETGEISNDYHKSFNIMNVIIISAKSSMIYLI